MALHPQSDFLQFEANFLPSATKEQSAAATDVLLQSFGSQDNLLKRLIQDLFVAEVFLSVDALDDAIAHFRAEPPPDATNDAALSRAIKTIDSVLVGSIENKKDPQRQAKLSGSLKCWRLSTEWVRL